VSWPDDPRATKDGYSLTSFQSYPYHSSMPLSGGQIFAGYRIIRLLGSGGMGEVYLAQHPRLPRRDALKLLPHDWSADAEYRARFMREADLASTLWHPHIVGVHDRGEEAGQLWISMDFVDGLDAARLLADRYPAGMPVEEVARIVTAVAGALDHAHKQGLLHRDVKPANIMVTHVEDEGEQRILLTDFGIARNVNDISGITQTNMTVGTVAYSAPEQLLGQAMDGRADQYSLAANAFHLLTGSHLFPDSNPVVVATRHVNVPPPALADRRPELADLDPILAMGLAKRPDDRFRRCSDFARALSEHVTGGVAPTPTAPTRAAPIRSAAPQVAEVPPQVHPARGSTRTRRIVVATTAVVAVVLIAGVTAMWRPWERKNTPSSQESARATNSVADTPPPATATTAVRPPPPPQPSFSPKAIDQVLLSAAQLTNLLGVTVSSNPAGGGAGGLAITSTSYGMADHSGQVTPPSCVGVAFTGEHDVYGAVDPAAIKIQTYGNLYGGSGNNAGPYHLEQAAAVLSSAEQAQQFLKSSQSQWETCSQDKVDASLGYENGRSYTLGTVKRQGDLITVPMASPGGENSPDACQQALGAAENVVVETRTCAVPNTNAAPPYSDPNWATDDAGRVAKAMLENVGP
jgi:serine/threonine protein kinase